MEMTGWKRSLAILEKENHMKKLITTLIIIVFLIAAISPILVTTTIPATPSDTDHENMAHGDHGLGNVNQEFQGIEDPPPWDNPPGLP
jgi:hypothetical protein